MKRSRVEFGLLAELRTLVHLPNFSGTRERRSEEHGTHQLVQCDQRDHQ